jgi:hypothetical protein
VDGDMAALLKKRVRRIEEDTGLQIHEVRFIRSATLEFEFQAYAPKYAAQIRKLIESRPEGLRLDNYRKKETRNPEGRGVEMYTAVHDYEFEGSGKLVGRVDLVVEARRLLDQHPLVEPQLIRLNRA